MDKDVNVEPLLAFYFSIIASVILGCLIGLFFINQIFGLDKFATTLFCGFLGAIIGFTAISIWHYVKK